MSQPSMEADDPRTPNYVDGRRRVDRISKLHEDLLHRILCGMPLIDAARTCILSRRWRRVWSRIPSLLIHDDHPLFSAGNAAVAFQQFVDGVLQGLYHLHRIQRLSLKITNPNNTARLKSLVDYAVTHGVQELRLIICMHETGDDHFNVPACESLRLLFLESYKSDPYPRLQLPASGSFSSLKSLHLIRTRFSDAGAILSDMVSTRCPRLRHLEIDHVCWPENSALSIRSRTLESLEILFSGGQLNRELTVVAENLKVLYLAGVLHRLEISVPGLELFKFYGVATEHFSSGVLKSLRSVDILAQSYLRKLPETARVRSSMHNLLHAIADAEQVNASLVVAGGRRPDDQPEEMFKGIDIQLRRVMQMSVVLYSYPHVFGGALAPLLKGCASLKELQIKIVDQPHIYQVACDDLKRCCDQTPSWRSESLELDSLEDVTITGLHPVQDHELDFVKLLCSCANLQQVSPDDVGGGPGHVIRLARKN